MKEDFPQKTGQPVDVAEIILDDLIDVQTGPLNPNQIQLFLPDTLYSDQPELDLPTVNLQELHEAVDEITVHKMTRGKTQSIAETRFSETRPEYGRTGSIIDTSFEVARKHGVYEFTETNPQTGEEEVIGIHHPRLKNLKEKLHNFAQQGGVTVIMPFHQEPGTIGDNIEYAQACGIGQNNVLGISTGVDTLSTREARASGGTILEQNEIFEALHVDWDAIRKGVGIDEALNGNKGMTLFGGIAAATLLAEYGFIRPDQIVAWHDTDPENGYEYGALPTMLIPFLRETPEARVLMSIIAKNGPGRNNEMIAEQLDYFLNMTKDPMLIQLACHLMSTSWYLSGERAFHLDILRNMPIATGIGIESLANAYVAGIAAEGNGYIANVANPYPKRESKQSLPEREFGSVVKPAKSMLARVGIHIQTTGRYPHQWTLEDIRSFNEIHGGLEINQITHANGINRKNVIVTVKSDYILPSINMMLEHDMMKIK